MNLEVVRFDLPGGPDDEGRWRAKGPCEATAHAEAGGPFDDPLDPIAGTQENEDVPGKAGLTRVASRFVP